MDFIWYLLGALTGLRAYLLFELSKRCRLDWISWTGLIAGTFLILFTIAWCAGSILEGVPRAASMGLLFFGFGGIVLLTLTARYVAVRSREDS